LSGPEERDALNSPNNSSYVDDDKDNNSNTQQQQQNYLYQAFGDVPKFICGVDLIASKIRRKNKMISYRSNNDSNDSSSISGNSQIRNEQQPIVTGRKPGGATTGLEEE